MSTKIVSMSQIIISIDERKKSKYLFIKTINALILFYELFYF